jgi:hypothetical protein
MWALEERGDVISRACEHEHEEVNMTKSFLEYSSHVDKIFKEKFVTPKTKYLVTWKNILPCVIDE